MVRALGSTAVILAALGTALGQAPKAPPRGGPAGAAPPGAGAAAPPPGPGAPMPPGPKNPNQYVPPEKIEGADLREWISRLTAKDPEVREKAIHVLPWFGPAAKEALPRFIDMITDQDYEVRSAALFICTANPIDDPKRRQEIIAKILSDDVLRNSQAGLRIQVAQALTRIGPQAKQAIDTLVGELYLRYPHSNDVRIAAATALGQVAREDVQGKGPVPKAIFALTDKLSDPCLSVRMEVVQSLAILGMPADKSLQFEELQKIQYRLNNEGDEVLKVWMRACLFRLVPIRKDLLNPLAAALESKEQRVRMNAAEAIGTLGPEAKEKINNLRIGLQNDKSVKPDDLEFMAMCLWAIYQMGKEASILKPDVEKLKAHPNEYIKACATQTFDVINKP